MFPLSRCGQVQTISRLFVCKEIHKRATQVSRVRKFTYVKQGRGKVLDFPFLIYLYPWHTFDPFPLETVPRLATAVSVVSRHVAFIRNQYLISCLFRSCFPSYPLPVVSPKTRKDFLSMAIKNIYISPVHHVSDDSPSASFLKARNVVCYGTFDSHA